MMYIRAACWSEKVVSYAVSDQLSTVKKDPDLIKQLGWQDQSCDQPTVDSGESVDDSW